MGNVKRSILYCMSSLAVIMTIMATFSLVHTRGVHAAAAGGVTREITSAGTSSFASASAGTGGNGVQWPEFVGQSGSGPGPAPGSIVNRSQSQPHGNGASSNSGQKAKSSP